MTYTESRTGIRQDSRFFQNFHLCLSLLLCYHMTQISYTAFNDSLVLSTDQLIVFSTDLAGVCASVCIIMKGHTHTHTELSYEIYDIILCMCTLWLQTQLLSE